jgi:hypothetical protein
VKPASKLLVVVAVAAWLQAGCERAPEKSRGVADAAAAPLTLAPSADPSSAPSPPAFLDGGVPTACYPQAVQLFGNGISCSGVVIDSQPGSSLVMTSGHCIALEGKYNPVNQVQSDGQSPVPVTDTYVQPTFNLCQPGGPTYANAAGRDLAIVRVASNLGVAAASLGTAPPANGDELDVLGYGTPNLGQRRLGDFHRDDTVPGAAAPGALGMTGDNGTTCPGDSGGPVFTHTDGCDDPDCPAACSPSGSPALVGINSTQPLGVPRGDCSQPQRLAASTTDPDNASWISQVKQGTAAKFDPTKVANCCHAGASADCVGANGCPGTKSCQDDGTWGPCQSPPPPTCLSLGKTCGTWSDGCGGTLFCGTCIDPYKCNTQGNCECTGICFSPFCGQDDGCNKACSNTDDTCTGCGYTNACGRACGCTAPSVCVDGQCCTPNCAGKSCGDDGCGGSCGSCTPPYHCGTQGNCECARGCFPLCGQDDGCGGSCSNTDDVCNGCGTTNACGRYCGDCCAYYDCEGVCNGSATYDCAGVCNGGATTDACGVCGGDGSECSGCGCGCGCGCGLGCGILED